MAGDTDRDNVVLLDAVRRRVAEAAPRPASSPAGRAGARARCAGCIHWVPGEGPDGEGRCFGHHRLPSTAASDGCSAWRRRALRCVS